MTYVRIQHATIDAEWEVSKVTFSAGQITRTFDEHCSSYSGNYGSGGALISFSAGDKIVSAVALSSLSILADENGQFEFAGPIVTKGQRETIVTPTISDGAIGLDTLLATVFKLALTSDVTTVFIAATAGFATSFILEITADGTPRTFTQPGNVVALTGAYTPSSGNGKRDLLTYTTLDGGTTWLMAIIAQNY